MEAISILLGVLIAPVYNMNLPCDGLRLGESSRVTISGVTAANHELGYKRATYLFIKYLFILDPSHMDNSLERFNKMKSL